MSKPNLLSGYDLVSKGFTKIVTTLPEVGLKDVQPNGSWLEQKQIQSALEARKHLIEVERIEKSGSLSVAVWREEQMLAEVIQKVGGHWQYLGHNIGNQLYLYPEEALYLMEVNSLQLLHQDIKVSLQQAYTLLLRGNVTLLQYKVYASLSRLGYRLFRREKSNLTEYERKMKLTEFERKGSKRKHNVGSDDNEENSKMPRKEETDENDLIIVENGENDVPTLVINSSSEISSENNMVNNASNSEHTIKTEIIDRMLPTPTQKKQKSSVYYKKKVEKLKSMNIKPSNSEILDKCFNDIPSLIEKKTVIIAIPAIQYVPKNIDIKRHVYTIDLANLERKGSPISPDTNIYSVNDEANGEHIRRLRSISASQTTPNVIPQNSSSMFFAAQNVQFRYFNPWRPAQNYNCNFNMFFQRPYFARRIFPQVQPQFAPHLGQFRFFCNNQFSNTRFSSNNNFFNQNIRPNRFYNSNRNRRSNALDLIKRLAARIKNMAMAGNINNYNIQSLRRLINTYNVRYKTRLELSDTFDIITHADQNIVETIELEDDTEPLNKKKRINEDDQSLKDNLNLLKQLANKLKDLENTGNATAKHRRALDKILKSFNNTYEVEYHMNNDFLILNSREITITSTSDSDCHIEETRSSGKILKNPFNILKRLSERQDNFVEVPAICCKDDTKIERDEKYSQTLLDAFPKEWLPPENDFGRAEVLKHTDESVDTKHDEFLYDFFTVQQNKFKNWLDLKISFFNCLIKAIGEFQSVSNDDERNLTLEEFTDMDTVLSKLRIIKTAKMVNEKCNLSIDFDVYNRNVQNFKKSNPPTPHFRIICLDESSALPSGDELATLDNEYNDNVPIVFAIVGTASVSYIQVNTTDIPMYISNTK